MTTVVLFSEVNSKFGAPILRRLLDDSSITVTALVTSPIGRLCDYYAGEGAPVDLSVLGHVAGIRVMRPPRVNRETLITQLQAQRPDYFIIANYQQILSETLLRVPTMGTVNFHPSPLPRYAGLSPFFWMAKNGECHGGVSAVWTTPGIDSGPLIAQRDLPLRGTETAGEIRRLLFDASWQLVDEVLPTLVDRSFQLTEQDLSRRTYFGRPTQRDREVDLAAPTQQVLRTIRACAPRPGAMVRTATGHAMRLLRATVGDPPVVMAPPGRGTLCQNADQLVARTGDGWLRVTLTHTSEALLAHVAEQGRAG